jgi:hypothetical protein
MKRWRSLSEVWAKFPAGRNLGNRKHPDIEGMADVRQQPDVNRLLAPAP